jgi:hypothetical protein
MHVVEATVVANFHLALDVAQSARSRQRLSVLIDASRSSAHSPPDPSIRHVSERYTDMEVLYIPHHCSGEQTGKIFFVRCISPKLRNMAESTLRVHIVS